MGFPLNRCVETITIDIGSVIGWRPRGFGSDALGSLLGW